MDASDDPNGLCTLATLRARTGIMISKKDTDKGTDKGTDNALPRLAWGTRPRPHLSHPNLSCLNHHP